MSSDPVWLKIVLAVIGPITTAILALIAANIIAARIQTRREEIRVRQEMTDEIVETASQLYFSLQTFWRAARDIRVAERTSNPALADQLEKLNNAYAHARVRGQVLEHKLQIFYADPRPAKNWHRLSDLLSVRYFLLITSGPRRQEIRERNAGPHHSGLTANQLDEPTQLLREIRIAIVEAASSLWENKIDTEASHMRRLNSTWIPVGEESGVAADSQHH